MAALTSFLDKAGLTAFWNHIQTVLTDPLNEAINDIINDRINPHIANKANPHGVTKTQVGLANVTNDAQVKRSEMGKASGVATLGTDGKIPSSQLPSYVDDVIEGYYNPKDKKFYTQKGTDGTYAAANQITGETGKIYVDLGTDDNVVYRYASNSNTYVPISDVPAAVVKKINDLSSTVATKADATQVNYLESRVNILNRDLEDINKGVGDGLDKQGITYDSASRKLTITLYCGPMKGTQSFEIDGISDTDIDKLMLKP